MLPTPAMLEQGPWWASSAHKDARILTLLNPLGGGLCDAHDHCLYHWDNCVWSGVQQRQQRE
jgi:hypothetical protein